MVAFLGSFFVIVSCTVLVVHGSSCAAYDNDTAGCLAVHGCNFCPSFAAQYNGSACVNAANCTGTCYDATASKCCYDYFGREGYPALACDVDAICCPGNFNSWSAPTCCAKETTCCAGHSVGMCCTPGTNLCCGPNSDGGGACCKECGTSPGTCAAPLPAEAYGFVKTSGKPFRFSGTNNYYRRGKNYNRGN